MSEKNPERHYYLYAKDYYKEGASLEMDLRKIQSNYCAVDADALTLRDVNCILQKLVYSQMKSEGNFYTFMDYLRRQPCCGSFEFELNVARACLIVLSNSTVMDIGFVLGKPDPTILPLKSPVSP